MATVFIDRDGTINEDRGFTHKKENLVFLPGAIEGLKMMSNEGMGLVIFTNQSGIGRGLFTTEDFLGFMDGLISELKHEDIKIDEVLHCPHTPEDKCECRKPSPQLLENYAYDNCLDLSECFVIGDRLSDIETGINAGCTTILINKEGPDMSALAKATTEALQDAQNKIFPDFVAKDMTEAAEWIIIQKNMKEKD